MTDSARVPANGLSEKRKSDLRVLAEVNGVVDSVDEETGEPWRSLRLPSWDDVTALLAENEQLREALELLGGVQADKVGDWEFAERAADRERKMREFARDVLKSLEGGGGLHET